MRTRIKASCFATCLLLVALELGFSQGRTREWHEANGYRVSRLAVSGVHDPGFTALQSDRTGITFTNRVELGKVLENHNLMNGSGVAAGDYDNDGWCDLYFCAVDGTNALYRNLGGWRFEEVTSRGGVGCAGWKSTGAVFADVDGDGDLDLLVATLGSGVHLLRNEGEGQFVDVTKEAGLATETGSTTMALGDVDGDGTLDLYVANYGATSLYRSGGSAQIKMVNGRWVVIGPNASRLRYVDGRIEELGEAVVLYLNNGQGRFSAVPWNSESLLDEDGKPMAAPLDFGLTVQMRDLTGDRFPEIYVCNDFGSPDRFWINDGKGRFRALPRLSIRKQSASSMGVDFADIDRDGHLDFFTTEMLGRSHRQQIMDMLWSIPAPSPGRFDDRPQVAATLSGAWDGTFADRLPGVQASDGPGNRSSGRDLDGYEDMLIGNGWHSMSGPGSQRDPCPAKATASSRVPTCCYPS
jgi:hypothetical protein